MHVSTSSARIAKSFSRRRSRAESRSVSVLKRFHTCFTSHPTLRVESHSPNHLRGLPRRAALQSQLPGYSRSASPAIQPSCIAGKWDRESEGRRSGAACKSRASSACGQPRKCGEKTIPPAASLALSGRGGGGCGKRCAKVLPAGQGGKNRRSPDVSGGSGRSSTVQERF